MDAVTDLLICLKRDDPVDAERMAETIVFTQQSKVLHKENEVGRRFNAFIVFKCST